MKPGLWQMDLGSPGVSVKVDASGRVVIPRDLRDALGIPDGGELRLSVENGELRATTRLTALRRIQQEVRALAPPGALLSEALIAERRAEARTAQSYADAARPAQIRAEAAPGLHEGQAPAPAAPPGRQKRRG
jgi:AbrB family looped-hinge helix DNA binding protein